MRKLFAAPLSWTRAIIIGLLITSVLLVTLAWIPSHFTYFIWPRIQPDKIIKSVTGYQIKNPYTLVRIGDAVSMGYQTVAFAIPLVVTYVVMERRRRRLGQQGAEEPKGYLPGK